MINFFIKKANQNVYNTIIDLNQLNNRLDCFKDLILSSLMLDDQSALLLNDLKYLDVKLLKTFDDITNVSQYLTSKSMFSFRHAVIVSLHVDVVILLHKLNLLVSLEYRKKTLKALTK